MKSNRPRKAAVADPAIFFRTEDNRGARYVSGRVVFDEQFKNGRLCSRYWSPWGQVFPEMYAGRVEWSADRPADTFVLALDGQNLAGGFTWSGAAVEPDPSDYRGEGRSVVHGVITLRHEACAVEVKVHTRLDGGPFLIRWLEITNRSRKAVGITAACPFAGMLWSHRCDEHLPPGAQSPFEVAYNHLFDWGQEGDFWFEPLPDGVKIVNGDKRGRSGHGRPAFWVRNRCTGQTVVCELAWGGNYEFAIDCRLNEQTVPRKPSVSTRNVEAFFRMGLSGHDPVLRVLSAGEALNTPAVHLAFFQHELSEIAQATHEHVRRVVMPKQIPGREIEIEANHRGYLCDRENEPDIKKDMEIAASVGAEMYVIDAGWYGNEPNRWWNNVGDWFAGSWLANGLEPIAAYARKLGLKFGLWVEIEAAGQASTLKKEHPEWLFTRNGEPIANGRALDLTQPAVAQWIESELTRIIKQYKLDMYRIDHNHQLTPSGNRRFEGYTEDLTWRYYESLYGIFDRLRKKFPKVVFQNCASGGGRLDWGTLHRFHNAEPSDWARQPRGLKILYGLAMSLPPEIMLRTFGTEVGEHILDADVDTQLRVVCLCRPIFRGIAPSLEEFSPALRERIEHHLAIYKDFIRPILLDGRVFHHTGPLPLYSPTPWCVLEYAAKDKTRAVAAVFKTADTGEPEYVFKPQGLDPAREYHVRLDNRNQAFRISGQELSDRGLRVRLENVLTSELILISADH